MKGYGYAKLMELEKKQEMIDTLIGSQFKDERGVWEVCGMWNDSPKCKKVEVTFAGEYGDCYDDEIIEARKLDEVLDTIMDW